MRPIDYRNKKYCLLSKWLKISRSFFLISGLFLVLVIPWGCGADDICLSNQHALQAGFYSYRTSNDSILQGTTIYGAGKSNDSIYKNEPARKLFLPLSFDSDTTVFVVFSNALHDTIKFVHTKETSFVSRKCGFVFNYEIDTVLHTETFIDSVSIVNSGVRYDENFENIKIFVY